MKPATARQRAGGAPSSGGTASGQRIGGLILAAGRSRRMGEPKALMHFGGRRVIDGLITAYEGAHLDPIVVVGNEAVLAEVNPPVVAVRGDDQAPMIDSIVRALGAFGPEVEAVVIQPVDQPFTTREMLAALLSGTRGVSRVMCHDGRPGHPVLVVRSLFDVIEDQPVGGLAAVLGQHDVELVEWEDERVLADLDTPEDVQRWRRFLDEGLH